MSIKRSFTTPLLLAGIFLCLSACTQKQSDENVSIINPDVTEKVDVFIGTGAHCHNFPSAMVPFGAVVAGPDCATLGWDAAAGYHYDAPTILGFSQQHLSGTGLTELEDLLLTPTIGKIQFNPGREENPESGYRSRFSHEDESAKPGYYQVRLTDYDVNAEMTATERVGFYKYTFPESEDAHILFDLVHQISGTGSQVTQAYIRIIDEQTVCGYRYMNGMWAQNRSVYFAMKFSKPFDSRIIYDINRNQYLYDVVDKGAKKLKAAFNFTTSEQEAIYVKIATSSVSMNNAMENMEAEIDHWDFDKVVAEADQKWTREMGRIVAKGSKENEAKFYAALYHNMIHPTILSDVNGDYRGIDKEVHKARGFIKYHMFSLWDTFRATHPLFTLIHQKRTNDIVKTMVEFQKENPTKMLPMWSMYQDENTCMIGLHAIPVVADAFVKGLTTTPARDLIKAMDITSNQPGVDSTAGNRIYPTYYAQQYYIEKGYHPNDLVRSGVSVTLEHAYDDWTVALAAHKAGDMETAEKYLERAQNYRNVWDDSTKFFRPKFNNGKFREPFDPRAYHHEDFHDRDYVEGNAWQYLFFVPHDMYGLMDLMGGKDIFGDRLEELFTLPYLGESTVGDVSGLIGDYAHGNEPCHHYAYLYCYAGRPWRTQEIIHEVDEKFYKAAPDGYIGNEDAGQMSAWYVFSAMGFYPVNPAGGIYIIGSPLLEEVTLNLENGKTFSMKANNLTDENIYVQSVSLNGESYNNVWLKHEDIVNGASLVFEMGPGKSNWGVDSQKVPYASGTIDL